MGVLLLASCARTGFQAPPELDGSLHKFDRPATEGIVLDVVGQDLRRDAAAQDVAQPDRLGLDLAPGDGALDAGADLDARVDAAAIDLGAVDTWQTDLGPADVVPVDLAVPDTATPPDTFEPDTFAPDTFAPDTFAPDTFAPDTATCVQDPPWWDPAFAFRRPLRIDETAAGQLEAGYSVVLRYDSTADVSDGLCLGSGDDVRVVRYNGLAWIELHRHLRNLNTVTTEIWFKTNNTISGSDDSYWLYLGNPAAGAPPAAWADGMAGTSAVYLAADDFEDDTVGQRPDGWVGAGDYTVRTDSGSQVLRVVGDGSNADYLFAGDYAWTDVSVQGRLRIVDTGGTYYGLFTRVESTTPFDTLWWGLYTNSKLELYELDIADPLAEALSSGQRKFTTDLSPAAGTTWHSFEVRLLGRHATLFYDGAQKTTHTLPHNSMQAGRIGLCAGDTASQAYWDDIIVRRYVSPEPTVSVDGPDEPVCP